MPATILVVDDDVGVARAMRSLLSIEGYNVLLAHSGAEALEMMQQHTPDLIISDVLMPEMDGYQFYEAVQREPRWQPIPFIFLTVADSLEAIVKGRMLGVDAYLIKPMVPEVLLATVRGKLRRLAARRHEWETLEQMRREIVAMLSHEFRTPLSTLKAAADVLLQHEATLSPADVRELHEHIQRGGDRLEQLVEDFLLTARIETGAARQEFEDGKQPLDLAPTLASVAEQWRPQAEAAQLTCEFDCPPSLPRVAVCEAHLRDALGRLLSNAIKFNRPAGSVSLTASADAAHVRVTVADTGVGIAAEDGERIFQKFVQAERSHQEQQGAGLGLAIAHGLITINGGTLTVESQVGEGSRFIITLPIQIP